MVMACPRCWGPRGPCDLCGGKGRVPDVQLSRHIRLSMLLRSGKAVERRIANDPTPVQLQRLRDFAVGLLDPVWDAIGPFDITSGLRVPKLNAAVGGSPTSAHVVGWGADIVPREAALEDVMGWLPTTSLDFDQAILEPTWIHLGYKRPSSGQQRGQLLRALGGGVYEPYTQAVTFIPRTKELDRCR